MRIALLKGNRFNPWHLKGFSLLRGNPEITAFRAGSEVQDRLEQRDDGSLGFRIEPIHFDTQAGNPLVSAKNTLLARYGDREPAILPFHDRLEGFDIVQTWELFTDWSSEAALARERLSTRLVVMVWDNIPFNMEQDERRRTIKRQVAAAADRFLVYTERSRRTLLIEGVSANRITRIEPGVDTQAFSPGPARREEFGISEGDFVILFVGWLLPRKGLDYLLLAVAELLANPPATDRKVKLVIAGSGPGRERIDALVARTGIAEACVFVEPLPYGRMPELFRCADVFVLPSIATPTWQEQFGMSLVEAMATGVPAVCTHTGAVPEIASEGAILCQPNDFVSLHEALDRLMRNPSLREDLGSAGRALAVERFDLAKHAEALSDVYDEVLEG